MIQTIGTSLANSWEAFAEDPVATLLPIAASAVALGANFSFIGLAGAASFMGHVAGAGFLGSGGYILYEAANGNSEQAKTDALRFAISFIPVAGGIQITGGSGTGGSISSGGTLVLSGTGELSFACSGEMTVEQGLAIIEGISGNPSDGSDSEKVEKFPENPNDFNPEGLFKRIFHTKNGDIIKWFDDDGNAVYEWDEDLAHGSHYHVISEDGNTRISNADGKTHFVPGDKIPK